jgi:NADPH-dependent curcumin reductase CurA
MSGWMAGTANYMVRLTPGDVMLSRSVGEVAESRHPHFKEGDLLAGMTGWQDYAISDGLDRAGKPFTALASGTPLELGLTILGSSGLTAYFGLLAIGRPLPGDTVLISGAAGAVGTIAGQLARIAGCRVIGTAGSDEKCAFVIQNIGFEACINYRRERTVKALAPLATSGIDVFFDSVGADVLEAGLSHLARGARVVICGGVAGYGQRIAGPANYMQLVLRHATATGFLVMDYEPQYELAMRRLRHWYDQGVLRSCSSVVEGFEFAPSGLVGMFKGENIGKRIIRIAEVRG